ncbi:MBL fold metallo-hydrolase [Dissulfuribacter thermophilus]|nr:ribonuclease Z [Dissulfuribacter thermophilus]
MIEVIVLGSGTCVPSLKRSGPGLLIRVLTQSSSLTQETFTIMVDSASGTLRQLLRAGIKYDEIDLILYTHFHPDHIGELVPYIFATKYAPGFSRKRPVKIMASIGLLELMDGLKKAFGHWIEPEQDKVILEEIPNHMKASIQMPPVTLSTLPLEHTPNSLAYRIEDEEGNSVVVSGDTDFSLELAEFAKGVNLLILECARPEGKKVQGHLTPSEAGKIAQIAGPDLLLLTHFYPDCDESDLLSPLRREFKGQVFLAEDLMRIPLCNSSPLLKG